ncbi:Aminoglycoside phosphotransferase [Pseudomonas sp. IT-194MI4]|uniref:Aminoglycoside phosphotransferase domain-containing protein n=1 Tax=Pseudomonas fluorescens TaxID=294 RepID=A0A5E7TUJ6_PSEFL|nr:hypothetical protein [Pseudomonas fluorescens]VVQ02803.1 hypothetical protein PS938_02658 [Pseudomonas fluorescens]
MSDNPSSRSLTPHLDRLLETALLKGAKVFKTGSSSIIFENGDSLLRLTLQGSGHNFLAQQSAAGNPNVVKVLRNYGAVALSDTYVSGPEVELYWLAEVERLIDIEVGSEPIIEAWLSQFDEDGQPGPGDLPDVAAQCRELARTHRQYAGLMETLALAAEFRGIESMDLRLSNCMRRPLTGELVWTDPLDDCFYEPDTNVETPLDVLLVFLK